MKLLHQIGPTISDQPLLWFGADFPCTSSYHNGYEAERVDPWSHASCADTIRERRWPDLVYEVRGHCDCFVCSRQNRHIFFVREGEFNAFRLDPDNEDDVLSRPNPDIGWILCQNCVEGNHPTPPIGSQDH